VCDGACAQLPSSLFEGYVPATMDLMVDFADKPELQLDLIHLLGLLSTDCAFEDYKKVPTHGWLVGWLSCG
jgi:hypothetical protein